MKDDFWHLGSLLRTELTAVHQQFFHILALREWKEETLLERITEIDSVDFKNAMQIIDLFTARGRAVSLAHQSFRPGSDLVGILHSELELERKFEGVLQSVILEGPEALAMFKRAAEPRPAYRAWLEREIATSRIERSEGKTSPAMAEFLAGLIRLVEQPMVHAFLLHHSGQTHDADNAWRISGGAMLYGAAIVRRHALADEVPIPTDIPASEIADRPTDAIDLDRALASDCAMLARVAAEESKEDGMERLCIRIAEDCELIANMRRDADFPAILGRSPKFESFGQTRQKHLIN
jgi:hypothetical protein